MNIIDNKYIETPIFKYLSDVVSNNFPAETIKALIPIDKIVCITKEEIGCAIWTENCQNPFYSIESYNKIKDYLSGNFQQTNIYKPKPTPKPSGGRVVS